MVLNQNFREEIDLSGISVITGSMDFFLTISLKSIGEEVPLTFSKEYRGLPDDPTVDIYFGRHYHKIEEVVIEIESPSLGDLLKIHIQEFGLYCLEKVGARVY